MRSGSKKVVIVGAGPAGLAAAYELCRNNVSVFIIEKESRAGGICKTIEYKGFKFDVGPHRFFTKAKFIEKLWKDILADDFLICNRVTRIFFKGVFFLYPIKLLDVLKQIGIAESLFILGSYLRAKLFYGKRGDDSFRDWVVKRFGERLYRMFFKGYTEKIWGLACDEISSEWAAQRIKGLSVVSVIKNAVLGNRATKVKSLIDKFYYPKYGAGQMYNYLLTRALERGVGGQYNSEPVKIEIIDNKVKSISFKDKDGRVKTENIDHLINSMPFSEVFTLLTPRPPQNILESAARLRYRSLIDVCLIVKGDCDFKDQWLYIHDSGVNTSRVQIYKNWSPEMMPKGDLRVSVGLEYFCFKDDDFWAKDDIEIIDLAKDELLKLGLFSDLAVVDDGFVVRVPYAYPVYTGSYNEDMKVLREYIDKIDNLQMVGRCGMYRYNNMDHSMITGMYAAVNIIKGRKKYNIWEVNDEKQYLEETN
ncbi:MAG: NAD(P)/FAD-dependent oxidoreductase [Candidatus Omnitrophota bacterium]|nr:NAD(P)/FAD-dependent oxidoreductase [Candidatus Omnitrophota bacterium]